MKRGHVPAAMADLEGELVEQSQEMANLEDMGFVTIRELSVGKEVIWRLNPCNEILQWKKQYCKYVSEHKSLNL